MTRRHFIDNGTPQGQYVPFTQEEEAAWDAKAAASVLPSALELFKAKRDQVVSLGVLHAGHRWHTDPLSQHAYSTAIRLGEAYEAAVGQPWATRWKTMTGYVTVGIADLVTAGLVVGGYVQAAFTREDELIAKATGGDVAGAVSELEEGWS